MPLPVAALALRKLELGKAALTNALVVAAQEYANGGYRAEPIVRRHFTKGNQQRYGWPPLSRQYALWKEGGTVKTTGGVAFLSKVQRGALAAHMSALPALPAGARKSERARKISEFRKGKAASKADPAAAVDHPETPGRKPTPGLPMLVLSGSLRDGVSSGRARVAISSPTLVVITWAGLPEYALYHQNGTGKMPKRSPVNPSKEDVADMISAARRFLSSATGTGGAVAPGRLAGALPARARVQ